jgi:phosphoribosyl-AMP cyclohydrolase
VSSTSTPPAPRPDQPPAPVSHLDPQVAARLTRDAAGLVPAVVQDARDGRVLMVGWMDDEALHATLTTGRATFWSRSRREYWVKGATSGHRQWVQSVALDCDGDALLVRVIQEGPACHTGAGSCFDTQPLAAVVGHPPTGADSPGHPDRAPAETRP